MTHVKKPSRYGIKGVKRQQKKKALPVSKKTWKDCLKAAAEEFLSFLKHYKNYPLRQRISFFIIPASILYLETIFRLISTDRAFTGIGILCSVLIALGAGLLLDLLCSIPKNETACGWITFAVILLLCALFALEHCMESEFNVYIDFDSFTAGAGGIATEAQSTVISVIIGNWYRILIYLVPAIAYLLFFLVFKKTLFTRLHAAGYVQGAICAALAIYILVLALSSNSSYAEKLSSQYDFDEAARSFSLVLSSGLDIYYTAFGNSSQASFDLEGLSEAVLDGNTEYNVTSIDLDELIENITNGNITDLTEYIRTLLPSETNEYTGLFEGMNLIQITAESFTKYAIDEELTPVLYMMATQGIIFEDYYQPLWSGSTTTGEYQLLTGLLPSYGAKSIQKTVNNNMYLTIGNSLIRAGYSSMSFHNGSYTYYSRYKTHPNLGYSGFIANGNGMTGLTNTESSWPQSDLEMMEWIVPRYITGGNADEPFNYYIMTLSGHSKYDSTNWIANKNMDAVEEWADENGYDYTYATMCYFANNLELEYAMEYLLEALEEADLLDNTVIVISGDHYPYSLSDDYGYNDEGKLTYYNVEENLESLYGFMPETDAEYNVNSLIIWTPSLEDSEQIVVSEPVSSVDVLPTLLNLFGCEFDSRLLAGRDALADDTQPLVIFSNYSWLTECGYYDATDGTFTPADGYEYDEEYIEEIKQLVQNKRALSQTILDYDYYDLLYGEDE